jgi:hypothetical protein
MAQIAGDLDEEISYTCPMADSTIRIYNSSLYFTKYAYQKKLLKLKSDTFM